MPLHEGYNQMLESKVADLVNAAASPAGAITAALFLQKFIANAEGDAPNWVHFDIMAFNTRNRPGRPEGGEAMGLRAVYDYLNRLWSCLNSWSSLRGQRLLKPDTRCPTL